MGDQSILELHMNLISHSTGGYFPTTFLLLASYAGCDKVTFIICLLFATGFKGNYFPGMRVNALDLSPNYAASILSVVNMCGASMGVVVPVFVGMMTPEVTQSFTKKIFLQ